MIDYPKALWAPSPNYWAGRRDEVITHIVMHGTAGEMPGCLDWLRSTQSQASVHYLVDRAGDVYQLVLERDAAWGNGDPDPGSPFYGGVNPNLFTISIEHERDVTNSSPITSAQQAASTTLVADIRRRHGHLPLIPHSLIDPIRRVDCPGPGFPLAEIDAAARPAPTPPPAPVFKHWQLTVAMQLRPEPNLQSMPRGALLPVGTRVVEVVPADGGAVERNGLAHVRTSGDVQGWLLIAGHMVEYTPAT